jgi:hypothetical protein
MQGGGPGRCEAPDRYETVGGFVLNSASGRAASRTEDAI